MVHLRIPEVFEPLWQPARYKGACGGRVSGKSQNFAHMGVVDCISQHGTRGLCVREVQKTLKESAKRLIEDKINQLGVRSQFVPLASEIKTPGDGLISFIGMQDHNAESMKSFEGLDWVWVEEAQTLSARSLEILRPTLRKETAELRFSWNPRRKSDPVDALLRGDHPPPGAVVVRANWSDNPFFPAAMETERQHDLQFSPSYRHIWEGDYATVVEGTYFATQLQNARAEGRMTELAYDPILERRAYFDIGYNDATTIWIAQFKAQRIYAMDYIEGSGQELGYYINELHRRGHSDALCFLPHDGAHHHVGKSVDEQMKEAGFRTKVVKNGGRGAAMLRVEAVRRVIPRVWFNIPVCEPGIEALGAYHERRDDKRGVGLGPEHDWCLAPETEVLTRYGTYRIDCLPKTGEVMTPCGWRAYHSPHMTRRNAPLVEVEFSDGLTVRCTREHLFLTESGWKSAECLETGTPILSCSIHSPSILTGAYTEFGRAARIIPGVVNRCTEMFGKTLLDQFRKVAIFTTGMMTLATTNLQTLSVLNQNSTYRIHGNDGVAGSRRGNTLAKRPDRRRRNGTGLKPEGFGTRETQSEPRGGKNGNESQDNARSVASPLMVLLEKVATHRFIAQQHVRRPGIGVGKAHTLRYIVSVKNLDLLLDVWCLTVPKGHTFALANGAFTHNSSDASDSFGLMCQLYEEPKTALKPASEIYRAGDDGGGSAWMAG